MFPFIKHTLSEDVDALSAEVIELKLETTQKIESVDGRLDELEREQAQIKERLDALAVE